MRRVLPEARWIEIDDGSHPVWHSFFEIKDPLALDVAPDLRRQPMTLTYWGIFEDNDPNEAPHRDCQRQRRPQRVLGVLRHRLRAGRL